MGLDTVLEGKGMVSLTQGFVLGGLEVIDMPHIACLERLLDFGSRGLGRT